jgi:hypothetical protein
MSTESNAVSENLPARVGQKPNSDDRALTSPVNGKLGGRPRGSGKRIDLAKQHRLVLAGLSPEAIAKKLGVCVRTLTRRRREIEE